MKKIFTLVMAMFALYAVNAQNAKIILEAHDVWGDGTGYQILIDAQNQAWTELYGPDCGSTYADWEYMIPANASAIDANVVVDGEDCVFIPAGTYSYLILNPSCNVYATNYIASSQNDPSNATDYVFEAGKTYRFTAAMGSNGINDAITIDITDGFVGVNEVAAEQVRVYPNPATTVLNVEGNGNVEITNILGQVIMTDFVEGQTQINVAGLNNGVYFVRVNGQSVKFIKK